MHQMTATSDSHIAWVKVVSLLSTGHIEILSWNVTFPQYFTEQKNEFLFPIDITLHIGSSSSKVNRTTESFNPIQTFAAW